MKPLSKVNTTFIELTLEVVKNTGYFNNKIDFAGSEGLVSMNIDNIKPRQIFLSAPLATCQVDCLIGVVFLHEPGAGDPLFVEVLEGNRALQERGLFLAGSAPREFTVCLSRPQADKHELHHNCY